MHITAGVMVVTGLYFHLSGSVIVEYSVYKYSYSLMGGGPVTVSTR